MPVNLELWLAFAVAATLLILIPGPTTMLVMGHALASGMRIGFLSLIGVALGDVAAIALSMLGLGLLLAASAQAFMVLKWLGVAYLIWLGIKLWRAPPARLDAGIGSTSRATARHSTALRATALRAIAQAFIVTMLNPKGLLFFAAFLPQFIDPGKALLPQAAVLTLTMVFLAVGIQSCWIVLIGRAKRRIVSSRVLKNLNRAGGAMLIGAGLLTAGLKRS